MPRAGFGESHAQTRMTRLAARPSLTSIALRISITDFLDPPGHDLAFGLGDHSALRFSTAGVSAPALHIESARSGTVERGSVLPQSLSRILQRLGRRSRLGHAVWLNVGILDAYGPRVAYCRSRFGMDRQA